MIAATLGVVVACDLFGVPGLGGHVAYGSSLAATVFIAVVGAIDDIRSIAVMPRLLLQAVAVAIVLAALPGDLRIVPFLPYWLERALLGLAILWFVNLTNFMDGIDWMTVAEVVPLTAGLVLFGFMGALPRDATIVALALCGAMIGFAPVNRPVARLFLGDVGSLPIGLLLGWLLVVLAGTGHFAAALLLPLYYLADATITLLRRLAKGEPVWQAHRSHFYQRATDNGFSVYADRRPRVPAECRADRACRRDLADDVIPSARRRADRRLHSGRLAALPLSRPPRPDRGVRAAFVAATLRRIGRPLHHARRHAEARPHRASPR